MGRIYKQIQLRRDTEANYNQVVLADGEPAYTTDTGKLKIGDGFHTWANLPEFISTRKVFSFQESITLVSMPANSHEHFTVNIPASVYLSAGWNYEGGSRYFAACSPDVSIPHNIAIEECVVTSNNEIDIVIRNFTSHVDPDVLVLNFLLYEVIEGTTTTTTTTTVAPVAGDVYTFGSNSFGQLFLGNNETKLTPNLAYNDSTKFSIFDGGHYHTLGIKTDKTMWAAGNNYHGQLGIGTDGVGTNKNTLQQVSNSYIGSDVYDSNTAWSGVSAGAYHTLALNTSGELLACGNGAYGALGLGNTSSSNVFKLVEGSYNSISQSPVQYTGVYDYNGSPAFIDDGGQFAGKFVLQNGQYDLSTRNITGANFADVVLLVHGEGKDGYLPIDSSTQKNTTSSIDAEITTQESIKNTSSVYFSNRYSSQINTNDNSLIMSSGEWTVESWIRLTGDQSHYKSIFMFGWNQRNGIGFEPTSNGSGVLHVGVGGSVVFSSPAASYANNWHHIALTRDNDTIRAYLDGNQFGTYSVLPEFNLASNNVNIGRFYESYGTNMVGYINDFILTSGICKYPNGTSFTPDNNFTAGISAISLISESPEISMSGEILYASGSNVYYTGDVSINVTNDFESASLEILNSGKLINGTNIFSYTYPLWTSVAAGHNHSLGINKGELYSWGDNSFGQLGHGNLNSYLAPKKIDNSYITTIGNNEFWVDVVAGNYHSLAITNSGNVYGFGKNTEGQLGLGDFNNRQIPTKIFLYPSGLPNFEAVDIPTSGTLDTTGNTHKMLLNYYGPTTNGITDTNVFNENQKYLLSGNVDRSPKVYTILRTGQSANRPVALLNKGKEHLITYTGTTLYGCYQINGTEADGEYDFYTGDITITVFGDFTKISLYDINYGYILPQYAIYYNQLFNAKKIYAGLNHSLILAATRDQAIQVSGLQILTCGDNQFGQLGLGHNNNENILQRIQGSGWNHVAAGGNHVIMSDDYNQLWSFGKNDQGQLGVGDNVHRNEPIQINNNGNQYWAQVYAGGLHSIATAD